MANIFLHLVWMENIIIGIVLLYFSTPLDALDQDTKCIGMTFGIAYVLFGILIPIFNLCQFWKKESFRSWVILIILVYVTILSTSTILGGQIMTGLFTDIETDDMIISGLLMASGLFRAILLIIASSQICRTKTKERIRVEPRLSVNTSTSREAGAVY